MEMLQVRRELHQTLRAAQFAVVLELGLSNPLWMTRRGEEINALHTAGVVVTFELAEVHH
jgi:hypothetical protein